jgi:septal ring factor EnvC (AmiA/AmiB activator)
MDFASIATLVTAVAGLILALANSRTSARKSDLDIVQVALATQEKTFGSALANANAQIKDMQAALETERKASRDAAAIADKRAAAQDDRISELEREREQDQQTIRRLRKDLERANKRIEELEAAPRPGQGG